MRIILFICFFTAIQLCHAQDYFIKTFSEPVNVTPRSYLVNTPDDGIIQATQLTDGKVFVRRVNKCGEQIWAKEISHISSNIEVVNCQKDTLGNFLFSGNLTDINSKRSPFILKLNPNGNIVFFKRFTYSTNLETITYSFIVNDKGEFFVYFNYNTGNPGPVAQISLIKLDANGNLIWFKSYPGVFNWGRCITTSDGGLLIRSGSAITKVNKDGFVDWSKNYSALGQFDYAIEVSGGYFIFRYRSGSQNKINFFLLSKRGEINWSSYDITNFNPIYGRGILRNNGNILFPGDAQGLGLMEIDTSNGAIINFIKVNPGNTSMKGVDLFENSRNEVFISGTENSGTNPSNNFRTFYLRLDDSLRLQNCSNQTLINNQIIKTIPSVSSTNSINVINQNINIANLIDEAYTEVSKSNIAFTESCSFQKPRGNNELGRDTILCPKQSIQLGNTFGEFDSYLWSTGERSKKIVVNSAGIYWRKAIAACDSLVDSLEVMYYPEIGLNLGNDTTICNGDSLELGKKLSFQNYLWSTDDTTSTIFVSKSGMYWLETETVCGKVRDSINVKFINNEIELDLGMDTSICRESNITLGKNIGVFDTYNWNTGQTTKEITINQEGLYKLEATNVCTTLVDSVTIKEYPFTNALIFSSDDTIFAKDSIFLKNVSSTILSSNWIVNSVTISDKDSFNYYFEIAGNYKIILYSSDSNNCTTEATKEIVVLPSNYIIPNIFSPNGDGINDSFHPVGDDILNYSINIKNRWGTEILYLKNTPWNGKNNSGTSLENGIYFYTITINFDYGNSIQKSGTVYLTQ